MRKLIAIIVVTILPAFASAQPLAALPAPPGSPVELLPPPASEPTAAEQIKSAAKLGKPLVVYVGTPSVNVAGATSIRADDHGKPGVYVYLPDGKGWLGAGSRFAVDVDHDAILQAVQPKARQPLAIPFVARPRIADDDDPFRSLRSASPSLYETLTRMERYTSAKYAQHPLSRTYRFAGAPFFNHVDRRSMERKWSVPGGLEHVRGWSSILLRNPGNRSRDWVDHIDPTDGISEIVHQRAYDAGATFADTLFNAEGELFEVRFSIKGHGAWDRFTAWRDSDKAPAGYVRLKSSECAACHRAAGTGAYDSAYIPGGDGVLSERLKSFEQ